MTGLLHDIGLSMIDPAIANKDVEDMTPEEFEEYKQHPIYSADLIARKKIPASSIVMNAILQHHERPDGSGFPNGETSDQIHELSRLCAIADTFDDLTSVRPGHIHYTPKEALEKIAGMTGEKPMAGFDPDLPKKLLFALLENESEEHLASAA